MDNGYSELEERLGHRFSNPELLTRALTHPSYAAEQTPACLANQRLEFLGDAVLQLIMTEVVFVKYSRFSEGKLTKIRSALTKQHTLVGFAEGLGLGEQLLLGKGEDRAGGRQRASNLADAFEALLGAIFLDGGLEPARQLCQRLADESLQNLRTLLAWENPKGALQELTQEKSQTTPVYEVLEVAGPEHAPRFTVRVLVDGAEIASAEAGSRRSAEREAAEKALQTLGHDESEG